MAKEIEQEWRSDSKGMEFMSQNLFIKLMFRSAHQWAIHIDAEEYVELLEKIYDRITVMRIIRGEDMSEETVLPHLKVELFQELKTSLMDEDDVNWMSCDPDESQNSLFEYRHEEDPADLSTKHFKRRKADDFEGNGDHSAFLSIREPFHYKEEVKYFVDESEGAPQPAGPQDISFEILADFEDVYPLGYPTEQYVSKIKNDVYNAFCKLKEDKKRALAAMKRELFEGGAAMMQVDRTVKDQVDKDPGLIEENNVIVDQPFEMHHSDYEVKIKTFAAVRDGMYNQFRSIFKDSNEVTIRPHMNFPRMVVLQGKQDKVKISKETEHISQVNKFGHNPTLERRLKYKKCCAVLPCGEQQVIVNVNYLIVDPVYETCFRSDV